MEEAIAAVRTFNRFYTRRVGALNARFLGTDATLPEARVLFEIANGGRPVAAELQKAKRMEPIALRGLPEPQLQQMAARFRADHGVVAAPRKAKR